MLVHLHNRSFGYWLNTDPQGQTQITSDAPRAVLQSLFNLERVDVSMAPTTPPFVPLPILAMAPILSHDFVSIRPRSIFPGFFSTMDSGGRLFNDPAALGPRMGLEVFQIIRDNSAPGEPIRHNDLVSFVTTPGRHGGKWISAGEPPASGLVLRLVTPGMNELFELLVPTDIVRVDHPARATIPYQGDEVIPVEVRANTITGTGTTPGGTSFTVGVSPPEAIRLGATPAFVPQDPPTAVVELVLPAHMGRFSPCDDPIRAVLSIKGASMDIERRSRMELRPGHIPYMKVRLDGVRPGGERPSEGRRRSAGRIVSALLGTLWAILTRRLPSVFARRPTPFDEDSTYNIVDASLLLTRHRFVPADELPLAVTMSTADPELEGLTQTESEVSLSRPIRFSFAIKRGSIDDVRCTTVDAEFQLEGVAHHPRFLVELGPRGLIQLDRI
jgi:hypothetical protein